MLHGARRAEQAGAPEDAGPRFGFTVSRHALTGEAGKARGRGHAVLRNRARRRLKEAVRLLARTHAHEEYDYVVIARRAALVQDFGTLLEDMKQAFAKVNRHGPVAGKLRQGKMP